MKIEPPSKFEPGQCWLHPTGWVIELFFDKRMKFKTINGTPDTNDNIWHWVDSDIRNFPNHTDHKWEFIGYGVEDLIDLYYNERKSNESR